MNGEVLNSWKEIAAYLGRGVRTVQRWENELALPVRRPRGKERSAVMAFKPELDAWLHKIPKGSLADELRYDELGRRRQQQRQELHLSTQALIQRTHLLIKRSSQMQELVKQTLAMTIELKSRHIRERADQTTARLTLANQTKQFASIRTLGSSMQTQAGEAPQPELEMAPANKLIASR